MKIAFIVILILHGLIHALGFISAFKIATIDQFTQPISRSAGIWWLMAAIIFLLAALLFALHRNLWLYTCALAIVISQILIISSWQDARAGTIVNALVVIVIFFTWCAQQFEKKFQQDVKDNFAHIDFTSQELLTKNDMQHLPDIVQQYLQFCQVVDKPKVINMHVVFEGEMRAKGKDYFPFVSEQYNFFVTPTRLFFMKGKMFGITVPGYHKYSEEHASMNIRLFGLFPVVNKSGPILDKTETVTYFNDMCLLAPATLIDPRITWKEVNDTTCTATFTNHSITVSATLYFNQQGQLLNFISHDRTEINDMKQYPFYTPVFEYKEIDGRYVILRGNAAWQYPEGEFTYGKFTLKEIHYNIPNSIPTN